MFLIRFINKWIVRILLLILITGLVIFFARDSLLKYYLDIQLAKATGLYMKVGDIHLDVFDSTITVKDIEIKQPTILNNLLFAKAPELKGKLKLWKLLSKEIKFDTVELNIEWIQSVESSSGVSTEIYMRQLAENINEQTQNLPWKYDGIDTLYLTIGHHQKVDLNDPTKIRMWRDMHVNGMKFQKIETPKQFIETLNNLLYGRSLLKTGKN